MNIFTQAPSVSPASFTIGPSRTRPAYPRAGAQHHDTSLGKHLTWDGYDWIAGDGAVCTLFDVYVDGLNGLDASDGLTPLTPKRTLAAALALLSFGMSLGLARGSHFREELAIGAGNSEIDAITVGAYGSGPAPIVDGSDPIPAGAWTLVAGKTKTYQATVTVDPDRDGYGAGASFRNLYENDRVALSHTGPGYARVAIFNGGDAAALANAIGTVETNPGTWFMSDWIATGSVTIYYHPYDDSDPRSNGKTVEYTRRFYALNVYGDGAQVRNVQTRRQRVNDGSLRIMGRNAYVFGCTVEDGHKHCAIAASGSVFDSCTFRNGYNGWYGSEQHLVFHEGSGGALAAIGHRNCTFVTDLAMTPYPVQGVISHTDDGVATFASAFAENPKFVNAQGGNGFGNIAGAVTVTGSLYIGCGGGDALVDANGILNWGGHFVGAAGTIADYGLPRALAPGGTINISGSSRSYNTRCKQEQPNTTVNVAPGFLSYQDANTYTGIFKFTAAGGHLALNGATVQTVDGQPLFALWLLPDTTYTGDGNHFVCASGQGLSHDNGATTKSLADWRILTGQDARSDAVGDASAAKVYSRAA